MLKRNIRQHKRTTHRRSLRAPRLANLDASLDHEACRAIVGVLYALVRSKMRKKTILEAVTTTLALMPDEIALVSNPTRNQVIDTAHLLTAWSSQSPYLHHGKPRPLYIRGREPSIESLIRDHAPKLDLPTVMHLFQTSNSLQKVGRRFVPRTVIIRTRGTPYQATRHVENLAAATSNFDHNAAPEALWPAWRSQAAECPNFPIRHLPRLNQYIMEQSEYQLKDYDAFMRRYERTRRPTEPTTRAGVQIFHYERSHREQSPQFAETLRQVLKQFGIPSSPRTLQPRTSRKPVNDRVRSSP